MSRERGEAGPDAKIITTRTASERPRRQTVETQWIVDRYSDLEYLPPAVLHFTNPSGSFKTPAKKARAVSVTTIVGSIETDGLRMVPVTRSLSRRFER